MKVLDAFSGGREQGAPREVLRQKRERVGRQHRGTQRTLNLIVSRLEKVISLGGCIAQR